MATEVFVWYRCPPAEAAAVQAAARALLAGVAQASGVQGRLLQRQEADLTCMEHYAPGNDGARLARLLDCLAAGWPAPLPTRHLECFDVDAPDGAAA